jgi:hypothetical protein
MLFLRIAALGSLFAVTSACIIDWLLQKVSAQMGGLFIGAKPLVWLLLLSVWWLSTLFLAVWICQKMWRI